MLEVKVNGMDDVKIKGDGTDLDIITDSSLAIATMAKSLSEQTGVPVKECLGGLMAAAFCIIDEYRVEAVDGHSVSMPNIERMFGKEGAGE